MMNADPASILRRFKGLCKTGLSTPHLHGLARHFDCILPPPVDDEIRFNKEECVIKDEQSFLRFIARIPEKAMAFVASLPPSNDPLLQHPRIDFDKDMVLVIISHEPNCFIDLDIVGVELTHKAMRVLCRYSEPSPVVQKIINYGTYCAVVVPRFDGEVVFAQHSRPPSR